MFHSHEIKGTIVPIQDYLILRPIKEDEVQGGIHIPDNARNYGLCPVIAAGPKCQLKAGDTVYIQKFVEGELKLTLNGDQVYAIRERHVNVALSPKGAKCPLQAVGNRVLIKRLGDATKEEFRKGVWIPQAASEKTQKCQVLSLGSGLDRGTTTPFEIKVGTIILIAKYGGTELKYNGIEYTIINENDVIGTLDEPKESVKQTRSGPVARTEKALGSPRTTA